MRRVNATSCYRRRPAAVSTGKLTPWLFPAGDPRTAPSAHQRLPIREQNLKRHVLSDSVALLYRTDRPSPLRVSVIHLHPHSRADLRTLHLHRHHLASKGQDAPPSQTLPSYNRHCPPLQGIYPRHPPSRHPSWVCRAAGSARGDRLYPPDELLAFLRQWGRDPSRTRRRWL